MTRRDDQLQTLKENDQWVAWGYFCRDKDCGAELSPDDHECPECGEDRTKPPLSPGDSRYYAMSNDPDTWGSYEEAVAYHERDDTHTHGVGYMLSESGVVVGLDLDGCRHPETGELEPWAEEIVERVDSYTEVSPSETGLRIFAVGILPGGGNKQQQERTLDLPEWVEENKNAEVEMYDDVRYMTYTGQQVDGTPNDVQKRNSAIQQVHADFVADDTADDENEESPEVDIDSSDRNGETGTYTNEFGTSLETIREWDDKLDSLLNRIEPAFSLKKDDDSPSGYDFSTAVKLLYWRFDDSDIANILRDYRRRGKLKRDDYIQTTIRNAKQKQTEQCDPPHDRDVDDAEDTDEVELVLDALLGIYEGRDDPDIDSDHRENIWKAVGELDGLGEYGERVADVLDVEPHVVERHAKRAEHAKEHGPIVVENGSTWYLTGQPMQKYELLNFELDVRSFLKVDKGPIRAELEATLPNGDGFSKKVEPKVFNKKDRFDDEILGESFGTKFNVPKVRGGVAVPELLDAIRMWVHRQDAPIRRGVRHMGVYNDELAIPGHTLGPDGWRDDPDTVYLEREIGAERRVSLPTDRSEYDEEQVAQIVESLPHTRDLERFLPVIGWFYAAPCRPMIDDLNEDGEFNHVGVTGGTGSGKTASLSYLWRCFGMSGEPFEVDMSPFALTATFASTSSIPLWFDEYKPSDIQGYKLDRFHDKLRKANRGAFAERGNQEQQTNSYKIEAPCVVSGEQAIQGPAERRRTVMAQFREETTDPGSDTAERFKDLVGAAKIEDGEIEVAEDAPAPEEHALAYYRYVVGTDPERVEEEWHNALERAHEVAASLGVVEALDDLEIQGLQTVVFGLRMYRDFAKSVGAEMDKLPTYDELRAALEHVVDRIGPEGKRKSHTDRFVELFGRAATAGYVERGNHYEIVREGHPKEELRVNLPRTYDALSKYAKDHDIRSEDLLNDHKDYRDRFEELAEQPESYVESVRQYTPPVSKCSGISTVKAMNELEFDRAALGLDAIDDTTDTEGESGQRATADGGTETTGADESGPVPDDADGPQADARRLAQAFRKDGVTDPESAVSQPRAAGKAPKGMSPESVEAALEKGTDTGLFAKTGGGSYYLLD
jgi:hypothetical protein